MASGFELAGVVLAAFPIVVKGLGAYVDGVQAIKYWRRYGWELRSYARRLRSQRVRYINTLELLFDGVLESEDELATLVNDPAGASWHEPRYDKMLRSRLDHSYEHFLDTLDSMMIMLRDLAAKLDISEDGKIKWDEKSTIQREMKRMSLVLSKGVFNDILDAIDRDNKELQELTHENEDLAPRRQRRRTKCPHETLKLIRRYARSLYNVLVTDRSWSCHCKDDHAVSLQLKTRPPKADSKLEEDPFRIILSRSTNMSRGSNVKSSGWDWRVLEVTTFEVKQEETDATSVLPASKSDQNSLLNQLNGTAKRRIRFMDTPNDSKHKEKELQSPNPATSPGSLITNICARLCQDFAPGKEIGHLTEEGICKHSLFLHDDSENHAGSYKFSLARVLSSVPYQGERFRLSRRERLSIALTLASSVLQLDTTLWLQSWWTSEDIIFHTQGPNIVQLKAQPYLCCQICPDRSKRNEQQSSKETLLALGLTLVELCFGKPLTELKEPVDDTPNDTIATRTKTAKRMFGQVYDEAGFRYGDIVKSCIEFPYPMPAAGFDDPKFQEAVYTTIVMPLAQNLDDFEGQYLGGKGGL